MLAQVRVENFKTLRDASVRLSRFTAVVGANASGKSSLLDAIGLLEASTTIGSGGPIADPTIAELAAGNGASAGQLVSFGSDAPLRISSRRDAVTGVFELAHSEQGWTPATGFVLDATALELDPVGVATPWTGSKTSSVVGKTLREAGFGRCVRLRLQGATLSRPSVISAENVRQVPTVADDGGGLAAVLQHMQLSRDGTFDKVEKALSRVVPVTRGIRTMRDALEGRPAARVEVQIEGGPAAWCPADQLSEGTLLALAVLTVVHGPSQPSLVLIDDLDRGLHPRAQREVVAALRDVLEAIPRLQIVCTTHSPYLIDAFDPADVRVLKLDAEGRTQARPLTDHPDWPRWSGQMESGEFWSAVGEDWVFGGG